jgi:hypothetical protein
MKREVFAQSMLTALKANPGGMPALRSLLLREGVGFGGSLTDDAVLKYIASQLASGRLRLCQSVTIPSGPSADPATTSAAQSAAAPAQTEKPFPLAGRSQPKMQESTPADQSVFPADVRLVALAQTLKDACRSGVPFCEECLKAASAGA